ncbi:Eco57I restriction-modification methylase domain-containing protein [Elizabethkingia miricola]|uniref:Eco57I restriction-modification methylase domain-containing protein n=4 Tax=Elizabethkingia miricola TaxID=172045 RepID=UPI000C15C1A2|nr:N-6 DNA methylase [Elizabethkingia miricola]PSL89903.1 N-6 DNA methylase [Elizabethkingia miricola]QHQ88504.1 SAM-dependent DNA methyltransferase [Elizabethkingia miricola]UIO96052.1 Eco57I restriction-modification methylase domain-containing protein [Elizabethkingia miricola]WER12837.1 N-6 DNA methylase [Elizabethkingia miricola]WGL73012.1 N-6 DNA methylase [Elizabethkingia miricola]
MKEATKYLSQKCNTDPWFVDRLIISAFLYINQIQLTSNRLLLEYCIQENDEDFENLTEFVETINNIKNEFVIEDLIELFEFVISPSDRIINGAIYTPSEIRDYIVRQTLRNNANILNEVTIADISCGCSGFLYTTAKELRRRTRNTYQHIFQNQIFGLDIQEYSVIRSRLLLSLLALSEGEDVEEFHFNLHQGDALLFNWDEFYPGFDGFQIIVGNPPYVSARNLDKNAKENVKLWEVCSTGNPDLYIPFFQIGYENLAPNGVLGFITMNTFFKSLNGRALRSYFEENRATVRIIDFGTLQIFKSKSTYTCICFLENVEQNFVEYYKSIEKELPTNENQYSRINYQNLNAKNGWNLNDHEIISRLEAIGKPFGEKYKTRHGIATLKNDIYIFKPVDEDENFFYLQNGNRYPIEKGICKDILNSNKLSRDINFDSVKEKVLFPYDNEVKPKALEEELLREQFPNAYEYLQIKRNILSGRDKGNGEYEKWFAFGRTQSLEKVTNKLFFPKFSDKTPKYLISDDVDLLFYNGQAIIGHSDEEMRLIKKILESRLFWYYIKTTSKPYSSAYYSLNGTYIKNFGIPDFANNDIDFLLNENNQDIIDEFLEEYYNIQLGEKFAH